MARSLKKGIDYFSHDVDMMQDRRIKLIKAKHGLIGYAIYVRLLEELYREEGYFIAIDDEFNLLFADDNGIDVNILTYIVDSLLSCGLFDKTIFDMYWVLTSKRIQLNFFDATLRRKEVTVIKEYLVRCCEVDVCILNDNVNINPLNDNIGTQSKVKKKESKEDQMILREVTTRFAPPTIEEIKSFFSEKGCPKEAQRFFDYYESNGWMVGKNKMKKWHSAASGWISRSASSQKPPTPNRQDKKEQNTDARERLAEEILAKKYGITRTGDGSNKGVVGQIQG